MTARRRKMTQSVYLNKQEHLRETQDIHWKTQDDYKETQNNLKDLKKTQDAYWGTKNNLKETHNKYKDSTYKTPVHRAATNMRLQLWQGIWSS